MNDDRDNLVIVVHSLTGSPESFGMVGLGRQPRLVGGHRPAAVTRPAPWRRVDLAARVLEPARLAPVISRCEVRV